MLVKSGQYSPGVSNQGGGRAESETVPQLCILCPASGPRFLLLHALRNKNNAVECTTTRHCRVKKNPKFLYPYKTPSPWGRCTPSPPSVLPQIQTTFDACYTLVRNVVQCRPISENSKDVSTSSTCRHTTLQIFDTFLTSSGLWPGFAPPDSFALPVVSPFPSEHCFKVQTSIQLHRLQFHQLL